MCGLVVGLIRMGLDFGYGSPNCGEEDTRPAILSKVHFLHFTIILFFLSMFVMVVVSLMTDPVDEKHVSLYLYTVKPVLRGQLRDKEKVAL